MIRRSKIVTAALAALLAAPAFVSFTATTARAEEKSAAAAPAGEPNTLSPEEEKAGFKLLFDGKGIEHFRNYKSETIKPQWQVKDGALTLTVKGGGDIITKQKYGAFELLIDYKIAPKGNSGIMFHVAETDGPSYRTGPEIQVQDNREGRDPQKAGWLYQLYPAPQGVDATKPAGEWNTLRIIINKAPAKSEIHMNGTKYSEFVLGSDEWKQKVAKSKFKDWEGFGTQGKGFICLQDHGDVVSFRNIKIKALPE
jgi:hypothetical protein